MKYFLDTEFLEGTQKKWFGKTTPPTIDLISIGIVAEDGHEYYAVSKDFNLKEAWNRYDLKINKLYPIGPEYNKVYWIRENVLKPIYLQLLEVETGYKYANHEFYSSGNFILSDKEFKQLKYLLKKYGKSNKQIAEEVKIFVANRGDNKNEQWILEYEYNRDKPEFYGYYADYDWVVFCWLFGKMNDLPKGFPMYCIDLKQEKDRIIQFAYNRAKNDFERNLVLKMDEMKDYPKQTNEHNALEDAKWNYKLYKFLNKL